ncbi:MAG: PAS domain S-box protein, partial [Candidatus Hermodarchaeota archaeon]
MPIDFDKELDTIINKSPVIVFLWKNSEGWPVEFVSENIRNFGYEPHDFLSQQILYKDIIYLDDQERVLNEIKSHEKLGLSEFSQEYRIISKNRKITWVDDRTIVRRNTEGRITHFQGIIIDITRRKELEVKNIQSEKLFRTILENTYIGFGITQDNQLIYSNKSLAKILGYEVEELINWNLVEYIEMIHPDYREIVLERVKLHQKGEEGVFTFTEFPIFDKNGKLKWFYTNETSIIYDGKPAIISSIIDITEMKEVQKKLIQSEQNFRKAYERENFLKDLFTHDMRNILHGLINIIESHYLKEGSQENKILIKTVGDAIQKQISRGTSLINNVRKISEIEDAKDKLIKINLVQTLKDLCLKFEESLNYKKLELSLDSTDENLFILADNLIEFVINNILMNAIIHNDNELVKLLIVVSLENSGKHIQVEFIDNGKGVPDYKKKLIFDREFT